MAEKKTGQTESTVCVRVEKDWENNQRELYVGLNAKAYRIRRGEWQEVPAGVAEVIRHSRVPAEFRAMNNEQWAINN